MNILFNGGPRDGQVFDIPYLMDVYKVPEPYTLWLGPQDCSKPAPVNVAIYRLKLTVHPGNNGETYTYEYEL